MQAMHVRLETTKIEHLVTLVNTFRVPLTKESGPNTEASDLLKSIGDKKNNDALTIAHVESLQYIVREDKDKPSVYRRRYRIRCALERRGHLFQQLGRPELWRGGHRQLGDSQPARLW